MANAEIDALLTSVQLYRIKGEEIRQQPLSIRKLLTVIQFVEKNKDLLDKFQLLGKSETDGGISFSALIEKDVYTRVYAFLRLLLPDQKSSTGGELLTDDWCMDNLTNTHIYAIVKTALIQNQLDGLFNKAKELMGPTMVASFRQSMAQKMETKSPE